MNEIELKQEVLPVVERAGEIVVKSSEDYSGAADFLKAVKQAQKKVADFFRPMKDAAHKAHKEITEKESGAMKPLTEAEATIKRKMLDYATEQERIRQKEQARLQEQADLAARKERERLEREASKLKTPELKAARMEAAAAVIAPVVEVAKSTPEIKGQAIVKRWKAKLVSKQALIDAASTPNNPTYSANDVAASFLLFDESAASKFAIATKGAVKVAGIEFVQESSMSSGSK
jgi:hypothetical protein